MEKSRMSAQKMNEDFGKIQKMSMVAGTAIAGVVGASIKTAADLEAGMSKVKAVSGASAEEMKELEAVAREMGSTTQFSASQAAEGLQYLSLAGFEVQEQIDALPSILNAAAAGNIELGQSADIVSNIMTGFGISASETEGAVDVLVKTMTTANTDLPQLGDAMKMVAPVAKSVGWSIEDTAAAIAKMSDAGIQGSSAGTALRASLISLTDPTGKTKKAMKDLKIEVNDAEGNMKPLPELMGHIASKMDGMTDSQKTATASQLVGREAAAGFIALLDEGEDSLKDYSSELDNAGGTAERVAEIQNDNLNGAFKEFKSAMEELGITIGQEFLPVFTDIVRKGSDVVRTVSELDSSTIKAGLAFAGTATAVALTASSVGKLIIAMRGLMVSLGPAGWAIAGVSVLAGVMASLNVEMESNRKVNLETADSLDKQADSLEETVNQYEQLQSKSKLTKDEFGRLLDIQQELNKEQDPDKIKDLKDEYAELADKSGLSKDELKKLIEANDEIIDQTPNVKKSFSEKGQAIVDSTDAVRDYIGSLRDLTLQELEQERFKAMQNEQNIIEENIELRKDQAQIEKDMNWVMEMADLEEHKRNDILKEKLRANAQERAKSTTTEERLLELKAEEDVLNAIIKDGLGEGLQVLQDQKKTIDEKIEGNKNELKQMDAINDRMIDVLLKQEGLTAEKGKSLDVVKEELEKLQKEKKQLEKNAGTAKEGTEAYRESKRAIDNKIRSLEGVYDEITSITGNAHNMNSTLGAGISKTVSVLYKSQGRVPAGLRQTGPVAYHTGGIVGRDPAPTNKSISFLINKDRSEAS
ncbi:phage tail tape measure protein [Lentibacillus saliphilus]|uniref:phage tail tape measure protein n=1 Tax=Lentibacillus saliphilus TaxID=2737028 RepID=UPI001C30DDD4|nr:phage tail tape measure protein [Lentibacillus saliphilus]